MPEVEPVTDYADPTLPADYYRRHAARVRQLASEATTPAVKKHLQDIAEQHECRAEQVEGPKRSDHDYREQR
jgi:hypothetical protein